MLNGCPVCKSTLVYDGVAPTRKGDKQFYKCPRCGDFYLSGTLEATIENKLDSDDKVAVLSHAIRKMRREPLTLKC